MPIFALTFRETIKFYITMNKTVISTTEAPAAIGPYSQAVRVGDLLYCSGQIPLDPATGEMPEGIVAQTERSIANVKGLLAAAGLKITDVVKTTVFLADMSLFGPMNEVYGREFAQPFPARSAVAVKELPKGALVEIEVIAAF